MLLARGWHAVQQALDSIADVLTVAMHDERGGARRHPERHEDARELGERDVDRALPRIAAGGFGRSWVQHDAQYGPPPVP
jgi:hypothetical protein